MNYSQKLFINSVVDIYSDILTVDLDNGECSYVYTENKAIEEVRLPMKWDEAKYIILESIIPEDHEKVLEKWETRMNEDAEADSAFSVEYHIRGNEHKKNALWKMNIIIFESRGKKQAVILCRDHSIDMKEMFHITEQREKDRLTNLYNRFKLEELCCTDYQDMETCGILFFDINDFKKLLDAYGMEEKEMILQTVAESLKLLENESILAFRYDRDQFLIIAKNCSKDQFKDVIHTWIKSWEGIADRQNIFFSVALGNAWDCVSVSVKELIARAQAHMYRNKRRMKEGMPMDYYLQEERSTCYGLYNKEQFVSNATYKLNYEKGEYCIVAVDIEHFKLYNRWWGRKAGEIFLTEIAVRLKYYEKIYGGIAAYAGGDDFAIMLPMDLKIIELLERDLKKISSRKKRNVGVLPALGVYRIPKDAKEATGMYDYAREAQKYVIGNYDKRICFYDESMTESLEYEFNILNESRIALERRQFYLAVQPKCRISSGKIVGAEALVRWKHPTKGMIMPGTFIPVLEKNGFISDLDMYVWEEVCRYIQKWEKEGITPVPISINVSRIDMLAMDVVAELNKLIEKYQIDKKYLKVEITESAYVDNADQILNTVRKLEDDGFTLLMDDFGSGYSSLNMLKEAIVDVLKIDMKFLDMHGSDVQKGMTILRSVIEMSNELNLPIIVEGVETKEQAELLTRMKVRYAQGYLFYRPMHIEEFENLIRDKNNVDYRGIYLKKHDTSQMDKIFEAMLEEKRMNRFSHNVDFSKTPKGFVTYKADESQELIAVDPSVASIFHCDSVEEFREFVGNTFSGMVYPEDRERVENEIWDQIKATEWKMDYIMYRIMRKDGTTGYIVDFGHLEDKEDGSVFQVFLLDMTEQVKGIELKV